MRYLHTMVRITDVDRSLDFYCNKLGMTEVRRVDSEAGRYTLDLPRGAGGRGIRQGKARRRSWNSPTTGIRRSTEKGGISATSPSRSTISTRPAHRLQKAGVTINRPPRKAAWPSSARPTTSPSSFCRRARRFPSRSLGNRCRTPASGSRERRLPHALFAVRHMTIRPRTSALRLAVQDAALSRRKHGFDSRRARHLPGGRYCGQRPPAVIPRTKDSHNQRSHIFPTLRPAS